jgi:peroxin-3
MAIFSSLSTFVRRHRRKLAVATGVSLAAYFLFDHFVLKRLRALQQLIRQEAFVREQIKRRFTQTQRDCYLTILALMPVLTQPIVEHLPVEVVTLALKQKKAPQASPAAPVPPSAPQAAPGAPLTDSMLTTDNLEVHARAAGDEVAQYAALLKTELWRLLKVKTITRFITLAYVLSALLAVTRLSMNILARRLYLETAIAMAAPGGGAAAGADAAAREHADYFAEQLFLSLSWWLLNKGWLQLLDAIEELVERHFAAVHARTELTVREFERLLSLVVGDLALEGMRGVVVALIFPPRQDALVETLSNTTPEVIGDLYRPELTLVTLVNETYEVINDDALFLNTLYSMVENCVLVTLVDNLEVSLEPGRVREREDAKVYEVGKSFKLASLLAQVSIQSGVLCDTNNAALGGDNEHEGFSGNVFVNNLDQLDILDELSASVYLNFQ